MGIPSSGGDMCEGDDASRAKFVFNNVNESVISFCTGAKMRR